MDSMNKCGTVSVYSVYSMLFLAIYLQAKQWVHDFVELGGLMQGYQHKYVTPYLHIMVFHVPKMLRHFGNIKAVLWTRYISSTSDQWHFGCCFSRSFAV